MKTKLFGAAIIIAALFAGCKGDQGDPGATGPQGPEGNANVASDVYGVSNWSQSGRDYTADLTVNELTTDIANNGAVEVFASVDGEASWGALPFTAPGTTENAFWDYSYVPGDVTISFLWDVTDDGSPNSFYAVNTIYFRVVCIAPSLLKKYAGTNWKDYASVSAILKLQKH